MSPARTDPPRAWQRMLSGRRLDLLDPSPLDVEIADIAHGLARVARWNGQTTGDHAFSVAQHSLVVEVVLQMTEPQAGPATRLLALLHDAAEYVIGDMISPFKAVIGGDYKAVENRLIEAIHRRFGLPPHARPETVKAADKVAAFYEATRLAGFEEAEAVKFFGRPRGVDPTRLDLSPWPTALAEARYLSRFAVLTAALAGIPQHAQGAEGSGA